MEILFDGNFLRIWKSLLNGKCFEEKLYPYEDNPWIGNFYASLIIFEEKTFSMDENIVNQLIIKNFVDKLKILFIYNIF